VLHWVFRGRSRGCRNSQWNIYYNSVIVQLLSRHWRRDRDQPATILGYQSALQRRVSYRDAWAVITPGD